jgi:hypothetical protein
MGALSALDPMLVAQVANPLVCAGGLVTIFAGSPAFKTAWIDVVTSEEKIAEQGNLGCGWRMVINVPVYHYICWPALV